MILLFTQQAPHVERSTETAISLEWQVKRQTPINPKLDASKHVREKKHKTPDPQIPERETK